MDADGVAKSPVKNCYDSTASISAVQAVQKGGDRNCGFVTDGCSFRPFCEVISGSDYITIAMGKGPTKSTLHCLKPTGATGIGCSSASAERKDGLRL